MRHGKKGFKLSKTASHRKALIKNLCNELFRHKRITTTITKAKAVQPAAERLLSYAKKGDLAARRVLLSRLGNYRVLLTPKKETADKKIANKTVIQELMDDIAPKLKEMDDVRKTANSNYTGGGYTRIMRLGKRKGDAAELAVLEIVGYENAQIEKQNATISDKETKEKRRMTLAERIKAKKEELKTSK
ncbi:50S ribosomal protein L17 [bacterium]|nr:MAG: 50S ribosomal protein L17 [bacterium]